ncbi:hypothetical protein HY58_09260 [Flavihumibacter sp. ZG627]|nr:hypothetical protein HY58_09260 [Flavihumibacter sp. ZG627]
MIINHLVFLRIFGLLVFLWIWIFWTLDLKLFGLKLQTVWTRTWFFSDSWTFWFFKGSGSSFFGLGSFGFPIYIGMVFS